MSVDQESLLFPHITVANIVVQDHKFLMVEELCGHRQVLNQPAGHLELGESLLEAVIRETLEETCWLTRPRHFLGLSQITVGKNGATYIRCSFVSECVEYQESQERDPEIMAVHWLTYENLQEQQAKARSPLVLNDIERHQRREWYPLSLISTLV